MKRILAQCGVYADDLDAAAQRERLRPWHLWPCNARVWSIWCRLQTQWMVGGMGGTVTGLNYTSVLAALDLLVPRRRRLEVFEVLQGMERVALDVWREREQRNSRS